MTQFDTVVIGGGPGGESAARYLAAEGLSVALVEDRLIGGECHYWACNPTKTLLRPIDVLGLAKATPGVRECLHGDDLDTEAIFAKRDAIIDHLIDDGAVAELERVGVKVYHSRGRLTGKREVAVTDPDGNEELLNATHAVVLATGTRPAIPDVPGLIDAHPWTNRDLSVMTSVPRRALVVGGGVVGVEFATILSGLGAEVVLLVRGDRLLRHSEDFAADMVTESLRGRGVDIRFGAALSAARRPDGGAVHVSIGDESLEVDEVVIATGRVVNTDDLGLESVGLPSGEFVEVDDHLQAVAVDGEWLYAMGDTTGRSLLSHISQYHAGVVADVIAARARGRELRHDELIARDVGTTPQVIFTDPQVVEVGRTEKQARADGYTVRTRSARYPQAVSQLAIFRDDFNAQAKLVIDETTDTLLGATFVGPEFSELVQAATLAVVAKVPLETLRHVVAPHPSVNQVWNPLVARDR